MAAACGHLPGSRALSIFKRLCAGLMPRRFLLVSCVLLLMDGAAPRLFTLAGETRLDRSHVRPNRRSTAFRLASLSKTVTAAAIVTPIERGGVGVGSPHTCFKKAWTMPEHFIASM